jgi:hypothetical protein
LIVFLKKVIAQESDWLKIKKSKLTVNLSWAACWQSLTRYYHLLSIYFVNISSKTVSFLVWLRLGTEFKKWSQRKW